MSVASIAWTWVISVALATALLAVHLRFTPQNATLSPLPLLCGGAVGPLLALILDHGDSFASGSWRAGLTPLLIGIAGAASVRIRCLVAGTPAAPTALPSPSNADLLAAIEAQNNALDASLHRFAIEQQQQSQATLSAALHGVIDDFHGRINGQFRQQLDALQAFVADTGALLEKHRTQQMETMHHQRRSADRIERSVQDFHALLVQGEEIATLAAQLRDALDLLGPRQEALAMDLACLAQELAQDLAHANDGIAGLPARLEGALDEAVQRARRQPDGVDRRAGQGASELQSALQRAFEQTRVQIAEIAGKQQLQMTAMHKELADALAKPLAAVNKQLTGLQSKLNTDLAPVAQQMRRAGDLSKR